MRRWIRKILLDLLRDDYEVKLEVTRTANPDLAYQIETAGKKFPPPPDWWKGAPSKEG